MTSTLCVQFDIKMIKHLIGRNTSHHHPGTAGRDEGEETGDREEDVGEEKDCGLTSEMATRTLVCKIISQF